MKRGWRTSEFWMAATWTAFAALGVRSLLDCPPVLWPTALIALPAVCFVVWFAGISSHNYAENRFQLKAARRIALLKRDEDEKDDPGRRFIFGRHVAQESGSQDEQEES